MWTGAAKIGALRATAEHLDLQDDDRALTLRGYRGWRAAQDVFAARPSSDAFRGVGSWLAWCSQPNVVLATRRRPCRYPKKAIIEVLVAAGCGSGTVGVARHRHGKYLAHPDGPVEGDHHRPLRELGGRGESRHREGATAAVAMRL